jgi:hypothetical protein
MLFLFLPLAISDIQFYKNLFLTTENKINSPNKIAQQNSIEKVYHDDANNGNNKIVPQGNSNALNYPVQPQASYLTGGHKAMSDKKSKTQVKLIPALPATSDAEIQDTKADIQDTKTDIQDTKANIQDTKIIASIANENTETLKTKKTKDQDTIPKAPVATKQKEEKKPKSKKFYAGIIAGPELSAIKMQNVQKVGINAGVIAGVELNKKIQVETGVLFDRKYYRSKGEYFKTNKITLPAGASITEVSGHCDMIEIPLNINYTLKQKAGHSIYISGGVSSFIMKKEVYSFEVNRNGYSYPRAMNYDNPGTYAFAVVNLGAGYDKKLGKNGNLRIAPSIKLPLKKMGTGSLPIQSATLMVGYTRKLF